MFVNAASAEQAKGIDQINRAIAQMDKVTQQNAANAGENASASEELNAQAESMNEVVGELAVMVGGTAARNSSDKAKKSVVPHLSFGVHKENKALKKSHKLNQSHSAFHQITKSKGLEQKNRAPKAAAVKGKTSAEKAIPFDDDDSEGFEQFNS